MMKALPVMMALILIFAAPAFAERIICASTTSTQNSGLFDHILPLFTQKTGIAVQVIAVGTGAAIETGRRGDVDVVFVHAKDQELEAVREDYFVNRRDVMYNDFVVVGPSEAEDGLEKLKTAANVFKEIAGKGLTFVSRGDNSGTHMKELSVWKAADISPQGNAWYLDVGQGMSKTLRVASEKRAYALTDRGTWLAIKDKDLLDMKIVFEGDPVLFNQYGVMAVNPEKYKHVKYAEAMAFVDWLTSEEGQKAIGEFKDAKGNQLFVPNAE